MKTFTSTIFFVFFVMISSAQAPNYLWAHSGSAEYLDAVAASTADRFGNFIVVGSFQSSSVDFDGVVISNANFSFDEPFVVKYDSVGNVLWANSLGANGGQVDQAYDVAVDASGNVYVTGFISVIPGLTDAYIAMYDENGVLLSFNSFGGDYIDQLKTCATDASGNLFAAGDYGSDSISLAAAYSLNTLNNVSIPNQGYYDVFIMRAATPGNGGWAKSFGSSTSDYIVSSSIDSAGNYFVIGFFTGPSIDFDGTVLTHLTGQDNQVFFVKFDPDGVVLWAKTVECFDAYASTGANANNAIDCSADLFGNIFIVMRGTGLSGGPVNYDGTVIDNSLAPGSGLYLKIDFNGNLIWGKSLGGSFVNFSFHGCSADAHGDLYAVGGMGDYLIFDSDTIYNGNPGTYEDMFIVKFNASGDLIWAEAAGAQNTDHATSCSADPFGHVFVAGEFDSPSVDFGGNIVTLPTSTWPPRNVFAFKIDKTISVGINSIVQQKSEMFAYPNPCSKSCMFNFPNMENEVFNFKLIDLTGKTILDSQDNKGNSFNLDSQKLPEGIFIAEVKIADNVYRCRVINK